MIKGGGFSTCEGGVVVVGVGNDPYMVHLMRTGAPFNIDLSYKL